MSVKDTSRSKLGESRRKDISRYMQAQRVKIDAGRHKGREPDAHIDTNSIY